MLELCKIHYPWTLQLATEWLMAYNQLVLANTQLDWITDQDKELLNCIKQSAEMYLTVNKQFNK